MAICCIDPQIQISNDSLRYPFSLLIISVIGSAMVFIFPVHSFLVCPSFRFYWLNLTRLPAFLPQGLIYGSRKILLPLPLWWHFHYLRLAVSKAVFIIFYAFVLVFILFLLAINIGNVWKLFTEKLIV